jgi:hypothetical protein
VALVAFVASTPDFWFLCSDWSKPYLDLTLSTSNFSRAPDSIGVSGKNSNNGIPYG